jgi:histidinol-phosphate aminotransferase
MIITRRNLFRHVGVGAAVSAGLPSLARASVAERGSDLSRPDAHEAGVLVRLHRNEGASGPSAAVVAAIRGASVTLASRYPDAPVDALRNKLAALHAVTPDQVILGCGSGDILGMAVSAFLGSRKKIIVARPTFELMADRARRAGGDVVAVPLRSDYSHDLDAMRSHADAGTGLVYVCNPNNPTGSLTRREELEAFIGELPSTAYVVIDEAYHHYVGGSSEYASFIDRPVNDRRVIVTRTFSAIHGLAGLRVGYAVASPETAALLAANGLPDNLNGVAALAAISALDDTEHVRAGATRNADDRQEFCNQANARMLRTIDSHANFVMLNTWRPAVEIVEHFRKNDVLVSGPFPPFDKYIRVSLGPPAGMREFWRVWDLLPVYHGTMTM